jgi:hypothetical protein
MSQLALRQCAHPLIRFNIYRIFICYFNNNLYFESSKRRAPVRKAVAAAPGLPEEDSSDEGGSSDEDSLTSQSPQKDSASTVTIVSFQVRINNFKKDNH